MSKFNKPYYYSFWMLLFSVSSETHADIITDWNVTARNIVVASKLYTPPANRVMAITHTAIYDSVNAITQEYPSISLNIDIPKNTSIEAAVAAASYTSLLSILPKQKTEIEKAYFAALESIPDGNSKKSGITVGKTAAQRVLNDRINDGFNLKGSYRPHTSPGRYVPTVIPAVPHWPKRKPWLLKNSSQFRPGPPPALNSKQWEKDFKEVKEFGALNSIKRSEEQTQMAKFWEATLPPIYHGLIHSIAKQPNRSIVQNARLFAVVTQATDDALIAVFDAKYHYSFWRPITAIRNADRDGNKFTKRIADWKPYIPTPMHPEYPCAHCIVASTVGAILKSEVGNNPMPILSTTSSTANGITRTWLNIDDFIQEVSDARIYDGVHYRTSTVVANLMGKKIGELAVKKHQN